MCFFCRGSLHGKKVGVCVCVRVHARVHVCVPACACDLKLILLSLQLPLLLLQNRNTSALEKKLLRDTSQSHESEKRNLNDQMKKNYKVDKDKMKKVSFHYNFILFKRKRGRRENSCYREAKP